MTTIDNARRVRLQTTLSPIDLRIPDGEDRTLPSPPRPAVERAAMLRASPEAERRPLGTDVALWTSFAQFVVLVVLFACTSGCTIPDAQVPPPQIPLLSTTELRRRLGNPKALKGIRYNRAVGIAFQEAVLANLPGYRSARPNTRPFPSNERKLNVGIPSVIPDGVLGAVQGTNQVWAPIVSTHPDSTFIEVKAVNAILNPGYGRWQLGGMIDALSKSPAASDTGPGRAFPSLHLIITLDAALTSELVDYATQRQVLVWASWVEILQGVLFGGDLRITPPVCLNCVQVLPERAAPGTHFLAPTFDLPALGAGEPDGLDAPILDDGQVGFPGSPGDTSPNP